MTWLTLLVACVVFHIGYCRVNRFKQHDGINGTDLDYGHLTAVTNRILNTPIPVACNIPNNAVIATYLPLPLIWNALLISY